MISVLRHKPHTIGPPAIIASVETASEVRPAQAFQCAYDSFSNPHCVTGLSPGGSHIVLIHWPVQRFFSPTAVLRSEVSSPDVELSLVDPKHGKSDAPTRGHAQERLGNVHPCGAALPVSELSQHSFYLNRLTQLRFSQQRFQTGFFCGDWPDTQSCRAGALQRQGAL